jgi:hypothetical protein
MNDNIEDNPSNKKFNKDLEGIEALGNLAEILKQFGLIDENANEVFNQIPDMRRQFDLLAKSPDKFNQHFSKRGWVAYESMNFDFMVRLIELAENGNIDQAESELVEFYTSEKLNIHLHSLRGMPEFNIRYKYFKLAFDDTLAKRHYSAVPLLLMMIDGTVNDVDKCKGFFAETTNMTAWDSIAAHSSGLSTIKDILNDSRKKTSEEKIIFPFRHGILHGRDLGFDNEIVTAKCWAIIFAIRDWAGAVKQGKRLEPPQEKELSLEENLKNLENTLKNHEEHQKNHKELLSKLENWKPRNLVIKKDIPAKADSKDYEKNSPEQEAMKFSEFWVNKKYGNIAKQLHFFKHQTYDINFEAGKIKKTLNDKILRDYKILKIKDCAPAISEVSIRFTIEINHKLIEEDIDIRLILSNSNGKNCTFGDDSCTWKFLNFLERLKFLS